MACRCSAAPAGRIICADTAAGSASNRHAAIAAIEIIGPLDIVILTIRFVLQSSFYAQQARKKNPPALWPRRVRLSVRSSR